MKYTVCVTLYSGKKLLPLDYGSWKLVEELSPWPPMVWAFDNPEMAAAFFAKVLPSSHIPRMQVIDEEGQPASSKERFI